jgi:ethanolaminephosphotransferase
MTALTEPLSSNMVPKQREMDDIVRQIYEAMESEAHLQSTLLVLCGDHGMNDAGNHGASSAGETSPALVFMSPKLKAVSRPVAVPAPFNEDFRYYAMVEQSDLAPTLGALLGFPVPKNNLGALILDFLPLWPDDHHQRQLLLSNAKQVYDIVTAASDMSMLNRVYADEDCSRLSTTAEELICGWQAINRMSHSDSDWNDRVYQWLQKAQELMSSMASNYDMSKLIQGTSAAAVALLLATASSAMSVGGTVDVVPFALITLLYGVMMFASSYVEEEQHFWYWSASAWLLYLVLTR